jgi:hypothetical protein
MRDHDRSRSGLSGPFKWLAGLSVAVALVGVGFFGWVDYTKQMARSPEVIATARTAGKESEPAKAPTARTEAAAAAEKAAAERAAAAKAVLEAAGAKRLEAEASQRAQSRSHTGHETTDSAPRTASATPPILPLNSIDAELAKLMTGNVAFNTPERTRVGEELSVQATLSTTLKAEELTLLVTEPGKVEAAPLKVSRRMIATLAGGSAFDISPGGPVTQWVSESEPTTWTWIVTPKTVGEQFLILTFDAIITMDGKDDKRSLRTFKKLIDVEVGWPNSLGEWMDLLKKWAEGVSYFWGLVIAVGGAAWAWLRRRARVAKATADQASISDNPTGW